jgi:hypothetical protein
VSATQLDILTAVAAHHPSDAAIVEAVIRQAANHNQGLVNANQVRYYLRRNHPDVRPACVGAVYSGMVRRGLLTRVDECPSEDLLSRNRNKQATIYRLTQSAAS